jgi:hypothetical protein
MPSELPRPDFYAYAHEHISLDNYVHQQVRASLIEKRSGLFDESNVHSYRHGNRWTLSASADGASEMEKMAAESKLHTVDVINHNTTTIDEYVSSVTAIGFPEILRAVAGARPKQANFILDACNAGGLGFDIGSILKRTIVGNSDTMGISFLASAAAEQYAGETKEGGRFTIQFAKALNGTSFIQQAKPFLSLSEIAQHVQTTSHLPEQTISYWTLNLQGPNLFARNPHFSGPSHVA